MKLSTFTVGLVVALLTPLTAAWSKEGNERYYIYLDISLPHIYTSLACTISALYHRKTLSLTPYS